jgi:polysaccharide deacetylase family protein (PEP-CTERM system associated)
VPFGDSLAIMPEAVTFTLDVEDYPGPDGAPRAPKVTYEILDFLDRQHATGTFFVVGVLAAEQPEVVREIAARGHEVGLHAWRHTALTEIDAVTFRDETKRGKELLEELSGTEVVGFRAPTFSLVPSTAWAIDVLAELGFRYSSSVLPAHSPLHGWPGQSRRPFTWPAGIDELPCPVTRPGGIGRLANPYLGGVYFRVLPWNAITYGLRHADRREVLWLYAHPYDFDPGEPFQQRPDLSRAKSRLLWINRSKMFDRVAKLFALTGAGAPLRDRLESGTHGTANG